MDFTVDFVFMFWADSRVLGSPVWPAVSCGEVDRIVLVPVLEEAPDDRVYPRVGENPGAVRATTEERSRLLRVWENVWIYDGFLGEHAWNPDLALPAWAVLQDLAAEEAV